MTEHLYKDLTYAIIGTAMEVHKILGGGFLESVYQSALSHEFSLRQIPFAEQVRLPVYYKQQCVGDFIADFMVEDKVIVEIKAVTSLHEAHLAQAIHYLTATGKSVGLLINFGNKSLEYKRVVSSKSQNLRHLQQDETVTS